MQTTDNYGQETPTTSRTSFENVQPSSQAEMERPSLAKECDFCGEFPQPDQRFHTCLFCGTAVYCSSKHQQLDWKQHKEMCMKLQARAAASELKPSPTFFEILDEPSTSMQPIFEAGDLLYQSHPILTVGDKPEYESRSAPPPASKASFTVVFSLDQNRSGALDTMSSPALLAPHTSKCDSITSHSSLQNFSEDTNAQLGSTVRRQLSNGNDEKYVSTEDPDIQVLKSDLVALSSRIRKRPTPGGRVDTSGSFFKDHNKNVVYSTTLQDHQRHLQSKGVALNLHQAMVLRLRYIAEHAIRSLNEYGWAVVDNFLGVDHYKYTAIEIERLYHRGLFSAGQLMEGKDKDEFHIKDIRSDQIYWYDGTDKRTSDAATIRLLISMIDSVIQHFKKRINHDIGGRSRAMIALYPGNGTRYVKHVDNPVKDGRCITTIYYCNENWDMVKDGGTLRLYPETSSTPMDIDPRADRLVFFWSDRRNPHEVMPVYRHRFAITIWYMDRNERSKASTRNTSSQHHLNEIPTRESNSVTNFMQPKDGSNDNVELSTTLHLESTDSGIESLSTKSEFESRLLRVDSLQSVSDAFKSERTGERRSSTTSENDADELPKAPEPNPEYII